MGARCLVQAVVTSLSDLALATGLHENLDIDARLFAPFGMFAYWLAWQLKMLPVYTLCAKIVPSGVEATLMSIISALNDLVRRTVINCHTPFLVSLKRRPSA